MSDTRPPLDGTGGSLLAFAVRADSWGFVGGPLSEIGSLSSATTRWKRYGIPMHPFSDAVRAGLDEPQSRLEEAEIERLGVLLEGLGVLLGGPGR